jgi:hypothetical protein
VPLPVVQNVIVCDKVLTDPDTGKYYLLGGYSTFRPEAFPFVIAELYAFFVVSNGRGNVNFEIEVARDREDTEPLMKSAPLEIEFVDPVMPWAFMVQFRNVSIEAEDAYAVHLYANGMLIDTTRIYAFRAE